MVSSVLAFFGGMLAFCSAVAFVAFTVVQAHALAHAQAMCLRFVCNVL